MTYVKTRKQRSCKAIMNTSFLDQTTGAYERINETPWYLKISNARPGYFLKMDDKFQQMPENCFRATAARSATFNFDGVENQIENFCKKNIGHMEVINEAN